MHMINIKAQKTAFDKYIGNIITGEVLVPKTISVSKELGGIVGSELRLGIVCINDKVHDCGNITIPLVIDEKQKLPFIPVSDIKPREVVTMTKAEYAVTIKPIVLPKQKQMYY